MASDIIDQKARAERWRLISIISIISTLLVALLLVSSKEATPPPAQTTLRTGPSARGDDHRPPFASNEILPLMALSMLKTHWRKGHGALLHLEKAIELVHTLTRDEDIVFIDAGAASYGLEADMSHFLLAAKLWGSRARTVGFEPGTTPYAELKPKAEDMAAKSGAKIVVENLAVSDKAATLEWFSTLEGKTDAFNIHSLEKAGTKLGEVKSVSLDGYTAEKGIQHITFLKIDVEGHEVTAMRGADRLLKEGRVDMLAFEYGDKWSKEVMKAVFDHQPFDVEGAAKPQEPTLTTAVQYLEARGMDVFFLGIGSLIPVSGPFWHPRLQVCLATDIYGSYDSCWLDLIAIRRDWKHRAAFITQYIDYEATV